MEVRTILPPLSPLWFLAGPFLPKCLPVHTPDAFRRSGCYAATSRPVCLPCPRSRLFLCVCPQVVCAKLEVFLLLRRPGACCTPCAHAGRRARCFFPKGQAPNHLYSAGPRCAEDARNTAASTQVILRFFEAARVVSTCVPSPRAPPSLARARRLLSLAVAPPS